MLKLCDKAGWMHSFTKLNSGSIYKVGWSLDGRNVWTGWGNGQVLFSQIVDIKW